MYTRDDFACVISIIARLSQTWTRKKSKLWHCYVVLMQAIDFSAQYSVDSMKTMCTCDYKSD